MASVTIEITPGVMSHTQLGTRLTSFGDEADEKFAMSWSPTSHPSGSRRIRPTHTETPPASAGGASLSGYYFGHPYNDAEVSVVPPQVKPPNGV